MLKTVTNLTAEAARLRQLSAESFVAARAVRAAHPLSDDARRLSNRGSAYANMAAVAEQEAEELRAAVAAELQDTVLYGVPNAFSA